MLPLYHCGREEPDHVFKIRALRNALICLAIMKMCSVCCYVMLYFLVLRNTPKHPYWAELILVLILIIIFLQMVLASLVISSAWSESFWFINVTLFVALVLAMIEMFLGVAGTIFFVRYGRRFVHGILAAMFISLAFAYIPVFANDWYLIFSYKKALKCCC